MIYAKPGSISHATMRNEDLIPCFMQVLEELYERNKLQYETLQDTSPEMAELLRATEQVRDDYICRTSLNGDDVSKEWFDTEDATIFLNEDLFDALDRFAAKYYYFGANVGDGSDYGFWDLMDEEYE